MLILLKPSHLHSARYTVALADTVLYKNIEAEEIATANWEKVQAALIAESRPIVIKAAKACSCVTWALAQTGLRGGYGAAKNYPTSSLLPKVGGLIVFKGSKGSPSGHMGVVTAVMGALVVYNSANADGRCGIFHDQKTTIGNQTIKGFTDNSF